MASGAIESYRAHRVLDRGRRGSHKVAVWVHAFDIDGHRYAFGQIAGEGTESQSPLAESIGHTPSKLAFGMADAKGIVRLVSSDVNDMLGVTPEDLIGKPLLRAEEQLDAWKVLDLNQRGTGQSSISLRMRPFKEGAEQRQLRCVITALVESSDYGFILIPEDEVSSHEGMDRVAQLEQRLWRIAGEVQASGIFENVGSFPDATRFPAIGRLTSREWEVLSRLLRGQRVPAIASALFVSSSTIRNNLSQIFKKFDVHSQSELLDLLNGPAPTA